MTTGMKRDRDGIKRNATPSYFVNLATSPAAAAAATTKLRVSAHHKKEEKKKVSRIDICYWRAAQHITVNGFYVIHDFIGNGASNNVRHFFFFFLFYVTFLYLLAGKEFVIECHTPTSPACCYLEYNRQDSAGRYTNHFLSLLTNA